MLEIITLVSTFTVGSIHEEGVADKYCKVMEKDDIVILDSGGGIVDEFLQLGDCIYDKGVNVIILNAYSAAAYTASAAEQTCVFSDSTVGYHTPYHDFNGVKVELSLGQLRQHNAKVTKYLSKWGIDEQTIVNINYTASMTHPDLMWNLKGGDISSITKGFALCEDLLEGED